MNRSRLTRWLPEIAAALFVLLFLYTGLEKLKDTYSFFKALERSSAIRPFAHILSWFIPIAELMIVVLLFIPFSRFLGLILGTLLMVTFTIYVAAMIMSSTELPCTCGGIIQDLTWREHLIVNLLYTLVGIAGSVAFNKQRLAK